MSHAPMTFPKVQSLLWLAIIIAPIYTAAEETEDTENAKRNWANTAEVSFVASDGNAETTTLGLSATFERSWDDGKWTTDLAGVTADSTQTTRRAEGSEDQFRIIETSETERTAEKYSLKSRYERFLAEKSFWFVGGSGAVDELAGINLRASAVGGLGWTFHNTDDLKSSGDLGLTYTHEESTLDRIDDDDFLGLRIFWKYSRKLTETTRYGTELELNENLDNTSDLRAEMSHSLQVSMSDRLALKVKLALAYDNEPALTSVPLTRPDGSTGAVLAELESLDSVLTVAMVLDF